MTSPPLGAADGTDKTVSISEALSQPANLLSALYLERLELLRDDAAHVREYHAKLLAADRNVSLSSEKWMYLAPWLKLDDKGPHLADRNCDLVNPLKFARDMQPQPGDFITIGTAPLKIAATFVHCSRGAIKAENPCTACTAGHGPFEDCLQLFPSNTPTGAMTDPWNIDDQTAIAPDIPLLGGVCGCCLWNSHGDLAAAAQACSLSDANIGRDFDGDRKMGQQDHTVQQVA